MFYIEVIYFLYDFSWLSKRDIQQIKRLVRKEDFEDKIMRHIPVK